MFIKITLIDQRICQKENVTRLKLTCLSDINPLTCFTMNERNAFVAFLFSFWKKHLSFIRFTSRVTVKLLHEKSLFTCFPLQIFGQ